MITFTYFCLFVGFIFTVNIIVLIVNIGIVWSANTIGSGDKKADRCERICFPCEYHSLDGKLCCDCLIEGLKKYLQQTYESHTAAVKSKLPDTEPRVSSLKTSTLPSWWMTKPVAKLIGSKQQQDAGESKSDLTNLRFWKKGRMCYMDNGIKYRNGRIVVPVNGTYRVYSFINLFKLSNGSTHTKNEVAMYKFNILTMKEQILCDSYSLQSRSKNGIYSVNAVYIGLDVRLNAGDEVYIKVTNLNFIRNPSTNIFGVYML